MPPPELCGCLCLLRPYGACLGRTWTAHSPMRCTCTAHSPMRCTWTAWRCDARCSLSWNCSIHLSADALCQMGVGARVGVTGMVMARLRVTSYTNTGRTAQCTHHCTWIRGRWAGRTGPYRIVHVCCSSSACMHGMRVPHESVPSTSGQARCPEWCRLAMGLWCAVVWPSVVQSGHHAAMRGVVWAHRIRVGRWLVSAHRVTLMVRAVEITGQSVDLPL